jgi:2-polyprenyl-3-methyl-5-hydroxy-6-metoxy-1,4-benzoquinol methylase
MRIVISSGVKENGIPVGNAYDKYGSRNPIIRLIMKGFESTMSSFVAKAAPDTIHEVGCGEGYWVLRWNEQGILARGSDFSTQVISIARSNAIRNKLEPSLFESHCIYDLQVDRDSADLVVCCEVLEHLEHPMAALQVLQRVVRRYLIISVPNEPLWSVLNLVRGKYVSNWGNTPGHIQHWSKREFIKLVSRYFNVVVEKSPLPWIMLLCEPKSFPAG